MTPLRAAVRIDVQDWVVADPLQIVAELCRAVHGRRSFPSALDVTIDLPDLDRLRAYVARQALAAPEPSIRKDQQQACADADQRVREITPLVSELLMNLMPRYGIATAARSCRCFLQMVLARTILNLASYQLAAADNLLTDLDDLWLHRRVPLVTAVQRLYGSDIVGKVVIARRPYPRAPEPYETVWMPEPFLKTHFPLLQWVDVSDVAPEIWTDVVLPQCIGGLTWLKTTWRPWSPVGVLAVFEGDRWLGPQFL